MIRTDIPRYEPTDRDHLIAVIRVRQPHTLALKLIRTDIPRYEPTDKDHLIAVVRVRQPHTLALKLTELTA